MQTFMKLSTEDLTRPRGPGNTLEFQSFPYILKCKVQDSYISSESLFCVASHIYFLSIVFNECVFRQITFLIELHEENVLVVWLTPVVTRALITGKLLYREGWFWGVQIP